MHVDIQDRPALRVGAVRHVGPYHLIKGAFDRLHEIVTRARFDPDGMLGLFYDDPRTTPPDRLRSDAAVVMPDGSSLPPGLIEHHVPAGRYAMVEHVGPYEALGDIWTRLLDEWLPQHGYRLGEGITYERYLNTPGEAPPEQLRTELYAPIA
jgi:AraC family transcriptional regulator